MKEKTAKYLVIELIIIAIFISGFVIGIIASSNFIQEGYYGRYYEGYFTINNNEFDGNWVHINISSLNYTRALEVCQHEVGHEIFAEVCEQDFNKCSDILK